jgi:hypothetical protein
VLLVFGAPRQLRLLAGQEHGRTIPLTDLNALCSACCEFEVNTIDFSRRKAQTPDR